MGAKMGKVHCSIPPNLLCVTEHTGEILLACFKRDSRQRRNCRQYNISVTATDEGTPPSIKNHSYSIHISDVNDNAPRFQDSAINVYVKENSPAGGQIATVSAQDHDYGENAQVTYSLLDRPSSVPLSTGNPHKLCDW